MSHFTVLCVGKDYEEQLEKYDEGLQVEPTKIFLDKEEIKRMWGIYFPNSVTPVQNKKLVSKMMPWNGCKGGIERGRLFYWSTYNKDSKWDWYEVGGRWNGFFVLKNGQKADQALKKDIDFGAMRKQYERLAIKNYNAVLKVFGGKIPKLHYTWAQVQERFKENNIDQQREIYWSQPANIKFTKVRGKLDIYIDDLESFQVSKKEFAKNHGMKEEITHAVLMNGEWFERGKMGWFGQQITDKGEAVWDEEFHKLLDSLPEDTLLTIMDCHI
jgi:hypothetical protein